MKLNKKTVFFIISIVLVTVLVVNVDFAKSWEILKGLNKKYLILAVLSYGLSTFFKSMRFKFFFKEYRLTTGKIFAVASYHNFFNQILPFRTGELTLVYYLKKICKADVSKGLHSLFVVRFMDLIMVGLLFLISLVYNVKILLPDYLMISAIALVIVSFILLLNLNILIKIFLSVVSFTVSRMKFIAESKREKVIQKISDVTADLRDTKIIARIPSLFITSSLVWISLYSFSYCVILSYEPSMTFFKSVLGATAAVLTNVLPINSFGSLGTMEAGWVGGFYLVGIEKNTAILSAFTYHLINILTAGILALGARVLLGKISGETK